MKIPIIQKITQATCIFLFLSVSSYGQLSFSITTDTIAYPNQIGVSGECLIEVANPSLNPTLLTILRLENEVEPDWFTAICDWEICHFAGVDSVSIEVPPQSAQDVRIYFQFLVNTSDTARCRMLFRNEENISNRFTHDFYGVDGSSSLSTVEKVQEKRVIIAPNPFQTSTSLRFPHLLQNESLNIIASNGTLVRSVIISGDSFELNKEDLAKGIYLLHFESGKYPTERIIIN
jgi:hypothetical protein